MKHFRVIFILLLFLSCFLHSQTKPTTSFESDSAKTVVSQNVPPSGIFSRIRFISFEQNGVSVNGGYFTYNFNINCTGGVLCTPTDTHTIAISVPGGGGGGSSLIIENAGTALAQRATLDFLGGLVCSDNPGASRTDCTIDPSIPKTVTNDTNVTGSISNNIFLLGWTGTLAANRLNPNVVQSVVSDTNFTGSILNQILTFGFTGSLSKARQNPATVYTDQSNSYSAGTQDLSAASHTLPIKAGLAAFAPTTCVPSKELYIETDATPGQQVVICNVTGDGWVLVGDGGSASSGGAVTSIFGRVGVVTAQPADYTASQITNAFDVTTVADLTNQAAPVGSPLSGFTEVWTDLTSKTFMTLDDTGAKSSTVRDINCSAGTHVGSITAGTVVCSADSSAYKTIQNSGTPVTARTTVNFKNGLQAVDNGATSTTDISPTYGTASGTVAQGNDSRIVGALQLANNLSDVANPSTSRTNLGLGSAATHATTDFVQTSTFSTLTDGATVTFDGGSLALTNRKVTLGGSRTLAVTNLVNGGTYTLIVIQDATGSRTLTLGSGCVWKVGGSGSGAVTLSTAASAIDILAFMYDGTNCYANLRANFN